MEQKLFTVKETATLIRSNPDYVYKLIKKGYLPVLKLGSYKIRKETIDKFLNDYEGKDLTDLDNVCSLNFKCDK